MSKLYIYYFVGAPSIAIIGGRLAIANVWPSTNMTTVLPLSDVNCRRVIPPLPVAGISRHSSAMWMNKVLVNCGGMIPDSPTTNTCYSLDTSNKSSNWEVANFTLTLALNFHTMTSLSNGSITVIGGNDRDWSFEIETWLLPAEEGASQWKQGPNLITGRRQHCSTLLTDSSVLVIGGISNDGGLRDLKSVENVNFNTNTATSLPDMNVARRELACTTVNTITGTVAIVAGHYRGSTVETLLLSGSPSTWTLLQSLPTNNLWSSGTLVTLPDNTGVRVIGGDWYKKIIYEMNPVPGNWSIVPDMEIGRYEHTTVLLPSC